MKNLEINHVVIRGDRFRLPHPDILRVQELSEEQNRYLTKRHHGGNHLWEAHYNFQPRFPSTVAVGVQPTTPGHMKSWVVISAANI